MNLNFPDVLPAAVKGVEATRQGRRDEQLAVIEPRKDMRGGDYYWIGFRRVLSNPEPGTDLHAIANGKISVTPLHLDLTESAVLAKLRVHGAAASKRKKQGSVNDWARNSSGS
jgi:5'-nucleotidase